MMDALDSLQSSSLDSKAERIARYKAERRRELAERYANLEESSSKYTRKERHLDASDGRPSSEQNADVSSGLCQSSKESSVLSEQGEESKTNSKLMIDATPSSKISTAHSDEDNQVSRSRQKHR